MRPFVMLADPEMLREHRPKRVRHHLAQEVLDEPNHDPLMYEQAIRVLLPWARCCAAGTTLPLGMADRRAGGRAR